MFVRVVPRSIFNIIPYLKPMYIRLGSLLYYYMCRNICICGEHSFVQPDYVAIRCWNGSRILQMSVDYQKMFVPRAASSSKFPKMLNQSSAICAAIIEFIQGTLLRRPSDLHNEPTTCPIVATGSEQETGRAPILVNLFLKLFMTTIPPKAKAAAKFQQQHVAQFHSVVSSLFFCRCWRIRFDVRRCYDSLSISSECNGGSNL